jgi:hypothetical protein
MPRGQGTQITADNGRKLACQIFVKGGLVEIEAGKIACVINDYHTRRPEATLSLTDIALYEQAAADFGLFALEVTTHVANGSASHKHHFILLSTKPVLSGTEVGEVILRRRRRARPAAEHFTD